MSIIEFNIDCKNCNRIFKTTKLNGFCICGNEYILPDYNSSIINDEIEKIKKLKDSDFKSFENEKHKFYQKRMSYFLLTEKGKIQSDRFVKQYISGYKFNPNSLIKHCVLALIRSEDEYVDNPPNHNIFVALTAEVTKYTKLKPGQLISDYYDEYPDLIKKNQDYFPISAQLYEEWR